MMPRSSDRRSESMRVDEESAPLIQKKPISAKSWTEASGLLLSGSLYILTSSSLILLNKHALASFGWGCPNSLLCFHCVLAVLLVKTAQLAGLVVLEPLRWNVIRVWFPGETAACIMYRYTDTEHLSLNAHEHACEVGDTLKKNSMALSRCCTSCLRCLYLLWSRLFRSCRLYRYCCPNRSGAHSPSPWMICSEPYLRRHDRDVLLLPAAYRHWHVHIAEGKWRADFFCMHPGCAGCRAC